MLGDQSDNAPVHFLKVVEPPLISFYDDWPAARFLLAEDLETS